MLKEWTRAPCTHTEGNCEGAAAAHLAGRIDYIVFVEDSDGIALSRHVSALSHHLDSRLHQGLSVLLANLVLGGAGQGNVILG